MNKERFTGMIAMTIHRQMVPVVMTYLSPPYPGKVKALVNLQGRSGGLPRKPILPVTDKMQLDAMQAALEAAGVTAALKPGCERHPG